MEIGEIIGLVLSVLFFLAAYFGTEIFLPVDPGATALQKKTRHFWALVLGLNFFLMSGVSSFLVLTRMDYEHLTDELDSRFENLQYMTAVPEDLEASSTPQVVRALFWAMQSLLAEEPPEIGRGHLRDEAVAMTTSFRKGYLPLKETTLEYFLSQAYMSEEDYEHPFIVATNLTNLDSYFVAAGGAAGGGPSNYRYLHEHAIANGIPVVRLFVFNGGNGHCEGMSREKCWAEYVETVRSRIRSQYPTLASVIVNVDSCPVVTEATPEGGEGPADVLMLRDWAKADKDQLVLLDKLAEGTWARKKQYFVAWNSSVLSDASNYIGQVWKKCEKEADLMPADEVRSRFGDLLEEMGINGANPEPLAMQLASLLVVGKE